MHIGLGLRNGKYFYGAERDIVRLGYVLLKGLLRRRVKLHYFNYHRIALRVVIYRAEADKVALLLGQVKLFCEHVMRYAAHVFGVGVGRHFGGLNVYICHVNLARGLQLIGNFGYVRRG